MIKTYIDAAISRNQCDIVLKNARFVDVFCGKIRKGDIAIKDDRIVGIGKYRAKQIYDLNGKVILPGFIDAHVHIESSKLSPEGFASLIVPRGTTTVIADPHEIVNVCGEDGARYIAEAAKNTPLDVRLMLPSCVPATPFETSGASLSAEDTERLIADGAFFGLGEFMNYPAVVSGDSEALKKLEAAQAAGKIIDGHAPALSGKKLNAYLCGGVTTDHECEGKKEIEEKLSKGMYVMLRHGSSARNLQANVKALNAKNVRRFLFCTDDRHASDIAEFGHIDDALRTAVAEGLDPIKAVTIATLNAAECYNLKGRGAIAPGYFADIAVVDDLQSFNVTHVFKEGKLVAEGGKPLFDISEKYLPEFVKDTVHIKTVTADDFKIALTGKRAKVITLAGGSLVTGCEAVEIPSLNGDVSIDSMQILKLAVVERHGKNGNIGLGLLKGYGFYGGAVGLTVAHDSHNMVVVGDDNRSMAKLCHELARIGGGMAIYDRKADEMLSVPLDIGGLMSSDDPAAFVAASEKVYARAYVMGVRQDLDAYLSLAFLSLGVIPHLKLLDTGLFDVDKFAFTDINA
ncbi:MAG: adenine deaminase [Clostridiales bacterium]|nr:adenine deaminase [Clostridiales bacterium]